VLPPLIQDGEYMFTLGFRHLALKHLILLALKMIEVFLRVTDLLNDFIFLRNDLEMVFFLFEAFLGLSALLNHQLTHFDLLFESI